MEDGTVTCSSVNPLRRGGVSRFCGSDGAVEDMPVVRNPGTLVTVALTGETRCCRLEIDGADVPKDGADSELTRTRGSIDFSGQSPNFR